MLASIERHRWLAGLSWEDIHASKKLPPLNEMMRTLKIDPLAYIVGQQLGSHSVHGSWPSLLTDYLWIDDDGSFQLRDNEIEPSSAQFAAGAGHVLEAAATAVSYAFHDDGAQVALRLRSSKTALKAFYRANVSD